MIDLIIALLFVIEILITLMVALYIANESTVLDFIKKLFVGKNAFGIILGTIAFIFSLPALLIILLIEGFMHLFLLLLIIWDLGNKKC